MRSFCNLDDVTFCCPCGSEITGEGATIANFISKHKKHTNGQVEETITDDGMRAFTKDSSRKRTVSL